MTEDGKLTAVECSSLAATEQTAGYKVLLAIAKREIENLRIELDNIDPADSEKVLAAQAVSYAAQKFWKLVKDSVDEAIEHSRRVPPPEPTAKQKAEQEEARILDSRVP